MGVTRELHQLIAEGLAEKVLSGEGDTVAVFGHAVFLNAVAIAVSEAMAIPDAEASVAVLELGEPRASCATPDSGAYTCAKCRQTTQRDEGRDGRLPSCRASG